MEITVSANPADYPMHTHRELLAAVAAERERCKAEHIAAHRISTDTMRHLEDKLAAERERCAQYLATLKLIVRFGECENYTTGLGSCYKNGRRPEAEYSAEACCYPCIADAAIRKGE